MHEIEQTVVVKQDTIQLFNFGVIFEAFLSRKPLLSLAAETYIHKRLNFQQI